MKCIGIFWNSMSKLKNEAIKDLTKYFDVENAFSLNLENNMEQFIWDIYGKALPIIIERVQRKIDYTAGYYDSKTITVLVLSTKSTIKQADELKTIKQYIRGKYSTQIEKYDFDNIFHLTENIIEYDHCFDVISQYVGIESCNRSFYLNKKKNY